MLVAELAREASERGPVFLFGLSVGGMTALRAAQRVRGVTGVIASTLVDLRRTDTFDQVGRAPWLARVSRWLFRLLPRAAEGISLPLAWAAPLERLSSDAELTRLLMHDPLIGKNLVSLGFLRSLHMHTEREASYDLQCPLLLVHPGADAWTPLALSMPVFDAVRSPKQCVVLSNGAHAPLEQPAYAELCAALEAFVMEHAPPAERAAE
jgi:alpha-beta hydrolase superfamily lysophospholipase